ncbi:hypothetical protein ABTX34_22065 [Streptomyces sp. NPDC096538]|uniref:hypothetical protein n=1 Tax=Streptomyces sp. NPDC096538 TaxID=3155427 RepID=UPI0033172C70
MGERQSDGGRAGRRRARPEGTPSAHGRPAPVSVEGPARDTARLEAALAAVLVHDRVDAGAEQRAVAAFVAARESGAHGARTRRRDDWRAPRRRFGGRSLRATLAALVAGCALSGVAVAGIGAARSSTDGPSEKPRPTRSASATSAPEAPVTPEASAVPRETPGSAASAPGAADERSDVGRPDTARDTEAHCLAYEKVAGRGRASDAPGWERLVAAAGGEERVGAYCAGRTAPAPGPSTVPPVPQATQRPGRPAGEGAGADAPGEGNGGQGEGRVPPAKKP